VLATLRPLELEVRAGRFRPDLYYRIQGIVLPVPPLRDRRRDIPLLLDMFMAQLSALHEVEPPRLSRSTRARLFAYDWPGNVRELRNVVEMLCILHEGKLVRTHHLPFAVQQLTGAEDVLQLRLDRPLDQLVEQIVDTVVAHEGNLSRAARMLGLSVRTLQRRRHRGSG
jgi:DNA-binding NtrC family response regulator